MSDLDDRVTQFLMLELPGQPQMMHMGTSQLVNDLAREVKRLRNEVGKFVDADVWLYQHEETGQIGFIDQWQVDNNFQENNPRLQLICKLYRKKEADNE